MTAPQPVPVTRETMGGSIIDSARISVMAAMFMIPEQPAPKIVTAEQEEPEPTLHDCLEQAMKLAGRSAIADDPAGRAGDVAPRGRRSGEAEGMTLDMNKLPIPKTGERWTDGRGKTVKIAWCHDRGVGEGMLVGYRAIPTRFGQRTNHSQTTLKTFRKKFKREAKRSGCTCSSSMAPGAECPVHGEAP